MSRTCPESSQKWDAENIIKGRLESIMVYSIQNQFQALPKTFNHLFSKSGN